MRSIIERLPGQCWNIFAKDAKEGMEGNVPFWTGATSHWPRGHSATGTARVHAVCPVCLPPTSRAVSEGVWPSAQAHLEASVF